MRKSSPLDNLRPGLLLDGRYKLKERIPRWVASRRFLAEARSESLQVLFFSPEQAPGAVASEWLAFLENTDDPFWLKPSLQGQGAGFIYMGLPLVRGPSLRQMLDEGRPWLCEDAARFLRRLVQSLRPLAETGAELPAISPETLLVGREGRNCIPGIFPLPLPGFPAEFSGNLPNVLRAILYELVARRPAPAIFDEEALAALPPPARNKWNRVFTEAASWDRLADLPTATRVPLPGSTQRLQSETAENSEAEVSSDDVSGKIPRPRSGGSRRSLASPSREAVREIHVPTERPRSRLSRIGSRKNFAPWSAMGFFSGVTGMVAVAAVAWFSWHLVTSLLHAEHIWTPEAVSSSTAPALSEGIIPAPTPVPGFEVAFMDASPSSLNTAQEPAPAPAPEPAPAPAVNDSPPSSLIPAESSPAESSPVESSPAESSPEPAVSLTLTSPPPGIAPEPSLAMPSPPLTPPSDVSLPQEAAGKIGSSLLSWQARWEEEKDNPQVIQAYERYLQKLAPQIDSMRGGRLPKVLQDLEKVAAEGFPAARYLLAQVLWGRDSRRSEAIMTALAREDYAPARVWCLERNITWN